MHVSWWPALAIFLSQFKNNSFTEICEGLKNLNQRMFNVEQIKSLLGVIPTKDDIISIQSFIHGGGDVSQLPNAEKFALEVFFLYPCFLIKLVG